MGPEEHGRGRELAELTIEELEAQEAMVLPDREAMSIIAPSGSGSAVLIPPDEMPLGQPVDSRPPDETVQPTETNEAE